MGLVTSAARALGAGLGLAAALAMGLVPLAAGADPSAARVAPVAGARATAPTPEQLEAAYSEALGSQAAGAPTRRASAPRAPAVVSARAELPDPVWVAARALPRGHVLASRDVALAEPHGVQVPPDALREGDRAVGQRLRRGVRPGTPLRHAMLEPAPAVRRGEPVRVVLERGALRIEGRGRARHDARVGELVRVLNLDSRRELVGRVGEDGVVYVGD